jgi:O-methyltransferase
MGQKIKALMKSMLAKRKKVLIHTMEGLGRPRHFDTLRSEYTNDHIRLSQLELAIHEIKEHDVKGDIAEVGVYKGTFASVMNGAFPNKRLYLFDTFEGFRTRTGKI